MLELDDFLIYAVIAAPFLGPFSPSHDAVASLLATLATFAAGFLMRPVDAATTPMATTTVAAPH